MTQEEYNRFTEELQQRGYRKYPSPRYRKDDYAWFKSFGESQFEEDRSNYQVCFDVVDFSPYANREPSFRDNPYGIEPLILISRTINEIVDLHLSYTKVDDTNIDEIERLAESFYHWAEKEVEV
jgi:hypothetical protein